MTAHFDRLLRLAESALGSGELERSATLFGEAEAVAREQGQTDLAAAGLSRPKQRYARALAEAFGSLEALETADEERLQQVLLSSGDQAAGVILKKILTEVRRFSRFSKQHDDMTLIVIKVI